MVDVSEGSSMDISYSLCLCQLRTNKSRQKASPATSLITPPRPLNDSHTDKFPSFSTSSTKLPKSVPFIASLIASIGFFTIKSGKSEGRENFSGSPKTRRAWFSTFRTSSSFHLFNMGCHSADKIHVRTLAQILFSTDMVVISSCPPSPPPSTLPSSPSSSSSSSSSLTTTASAFSLFLEEEEAEGKEESFSFPSFFSRIISSNWAPLPEQ
mmetsp:Transcript_14704/g.22961  ORF Transcript_14704/g.22961 Transcript_14704/m.22961 type:complete len:211 (+) Transcript_14704:1412-2044(+)